MQIDDLLRRVESLPPLPRTIILIEEYRRKSEKEISELHDIISKDALIVTNLLKIANSAMFGFRSKVETPLRAISLLGINFTISVAISASSQKLLVTTLAPYGLTNDNFMNSSNIASVLASLWLGKIDETIKDEIILPALLIDIGKYIIADMILNEQKEKEFKAQIEEGILSIEEVEKEFLGFSSSYVTAQIFKHWKLSPNLINSIEFVDDINSVSKEFERKAKILSVIKTVANIKEFCRNGIRDIKDRSKDEASGDDIFGGTKKNEKKDKDDIF